MSFVFHWSYIFPSLCLIIVFFNSVQSLFTREASNDKDTSSTVNHSMSISTSLHLWILLQFFSRYLVNPDDSLWRRPSSCNHHLILIQTNRSWTIQVFLLHILFQLLHDPFILVNIIFEYSSVIGIISKDHDISLTLIIMKLLTLGQSVCCINNSTKIFYFQSIFKSKEDEVLGRRWDSIHEVDITQLLLFLFHEGFSFWE